MNYHGLAGIFSKKKCIYHFLQTEKNFNAGKKRLIIFSLFSTLISSKSKLK